MTCAACWLGQRSSLTICWTWLTQSLDCCWLLCAVCHWTVLSETSSLKVLCRMPRSRYVLVYTMCSIDFENMFLLPYFDLFIRMKVRVLYRPWNTQSSCLLSLCLSLSLSFCLSLSLSPLSLSLSFSLCHPLVLKLYTCFTWSDIALGWSMS